MPFIERYSIIYKTSESIYIVLANSDYMEVILDTNFIISCLKKHIDLVEQLEGQGFKVLVPREVLEEMKDLRTSSKVSHADRVAIALGLELFSGNGITHISLGRRKVDEGLISKGRQGYYIATLDAAIKRQVPRSVVIFDAQKCVGPEKGS
jgi:rRNA-processing protein FCF1